MHQDDKVMNDGSKNDYDHTDKVETVSIDGVRNDELNIANVEQAEKKLVRTLDLHLMIWAFFGYFANGLDRNNMPNAQTTGLSEDLGLIGNQYNWAITMFFIGYIV
jgi:sugar phosphate permease